MGVSFGKKTPFGCQECKRRRIKCSDVRITNDKDALKNTEHQACMNCIKANRSTAHKLECIYLDLSEQKQLRKIRKILKSQAKKLNKTQSQNGAEDPFIDNYMIIKKYIRSNDIIDYQAAFDFKSNLTPQKDYYLVASDVVASDLAKNQSVVSDAVASDFTNKVAVSSDAVSSDLAKAFSVAEVNGATHSSVDVLSSNNWDFMFDDIFNLMNTINSDTNSTDSFEVHESLEQESKFSKQQFISSNNDDIYSWHELEIFFISIKEKFDIDDKDIDYFKIFYEKITYWIFPFQLITKNNIINKIFFNYILSKNENTITGKHTPFKKDPLLLGMLALAAKYEETTKKKKLDRTSDSSQYAELAITHLNNKIVDITKTKDHFSLLNNCIGSLTITILLLVIYNSSQNGSNWRSHQRGAKNIYLKYLRHKSNGSGSLTVVEMDLLMLFKQWFPTFDMLASFMSLQKGTLTTAEYNSYFRENKLDSINSHLVTADLGNNKLGYNPFQGYGNILMNLIVKLLDFVVINEGKEEKEIDLDFFFTIMGDINDCRNYYYKKNYYGILDKKTALFNDDKHGIVTIDGNEYSIFDMTHSSHTNVITIVFLQRLNKKYNDFTGLIDENFKELKQILSFMFKKNFDYKRELENDLETILNSQKEVDIDTFTDKLTFHKLLNPILYGDFKLLMFFSAVHIYATSLTKEKENCFEERCKILSYCQSLYMQCGSTGCFTSFKYYISIWKMFDAQKESSNRLNSKNLYTMSVPFI
ncbi:hypothetical protein QEN19_002110 [Hanseniaspora menglaensis]